MTRSMRGVWCLAIGLFLVVPGARGQESTGEEGFRPNHLGDSAVDLVYTPVTPCRIIDTRLAGGPIAANTTRDFRVTGDTTSQGGANCGIPSGVTAAVINFVAVSPVGPGNLRITPYGKAIPKAAIINYTAGVTIANGLPVAICDPATPTCQKDFTIQADVSATDLVGDVQGYFRNVTTGGIGSALLADGAVTAAKVAPGAVVKSLNGQTDAVTLAGANGLSAITASGTVTVTSSATSANTPSTIVLRDGTGNLSAGTITASLNGNASTATTAGSVSGSFGGEVTGTQVATVVSNAVSTNAPSAIVRRDSSGNFSAGTLTLLGNLALQATQSPSVGVITMNTQPFLHNSGDGTFVGIFAGNTTLTGGFNSGFGRNALSSDTTGGSNAAFGNGALHGNTSGGSNSAFGYGSLYESTGNFNTAVGVMAGYNLTSGDYNIYIANQGAASESGVIRIGTVGQHTATYIAGISGSTSASGTAVYVNSSGLLGSTTSSRRYKEEVTDMAGESDVLMKLRPVSFYYRPELDATHTRQYGLVAEEVAEIAPELVLNDENGAPQTVRYHFVNAMLLNEVQKQQGQIESQGAEIRQLKEQLARLEARLAQ